MKEKKVEVSKMKAIINLSILILSLCHIKAQDVSNAGSSDGGSSGTSGVTGAGGGGGGDANNPVQGFNRGFAYNSGIRPYNVGYSYFQPFGNLAQQQGSSPAASGGATQGVASGQGFSPQGGGNIVQFGGQAAPQYQVQQVPVQQIPVQQIPVQQIPVQQVPFNPSEYGIPGSFLGGGGGGNDFPGLGSGNSDGFGFGSNSNGFSLPGSDSGDAFGLGGGSGSENPFGLGGGSSDGLGLGNLGGGGGGGDGLFGKRIFFFA